MLFFALFLFFRNDCNSRLKKRDGSQVSNKVRHQTSSTATCGDEALRNHCSPMGSTRPEVHTSATLNFGDAVVGQGLAPAPAFVRPLGPSRRHTGSRCVHAHQQFEEEVHHPLVRPATQKCISRWHSSRLQTFGNSHAMYYLAFRANLNLEYRAHATGFFVVSLARSS